MQITKIPALKNNLTQTVCDVFHIIFIGKAFHFIVYMLFLFLVFLKEQYILYHGRLNVSVLLKSPVNMMSQEFMAGSDD